MQDVLLGALSPRKDGCSFDVLRSACHFTPRLARSGLSNVHPQLLANDAHKVKRLAGSSILAGRCALHTASARCGGNPDLNGGSPGPPRGARGETDIDSRGRRNLVEPGGRLVYATCSVLPD